MTKAFPLPVRMVGPGSQPVEDDELSYLAIPHEMNTFSMPSVPDGTDPTSLATARDVLAAFLGLLDGWDPASAWQGPRLDLAGLPADVLKIVNEMLGEGEVAIQVGGRHRFRIQESVFAGLWRVHALDGDGALAADWLEAAPIPQVVLDLARGAARVGVTSIELPAGAMNSPALLAEIDAQIASREPNATAHVINLTLFPMTVEDHAALEQALPVGPVAVMSRGFGNCRITSTGTRDVWRVQYFNSMNTLILNTLEIVDVPEVAIAAAEDLADSRTRLAELVDWMSESCEAPAES